MMGNLQEYREAMAAIPGITEDEARRAAAVFARKLQRAGSRLGKTRTATKAKASPDPNRRPGENRAQHRARNKTRDRDYP